MSKDSFYEHISSAETALYSFAISEEIRRSIRERLHQAKQELMRELIVRYALEKTSLCLKEIELLNSLSEVGAVYSCQFQSESEYLQNLIKKGYVLELENLVFVSAKYLELRQKC